MRPLGLLAKVPSPCSLEPAYTQKGSHIRWLKLDLSLYCASDFEFGPVLSYTRVAQSLVMLGRALSHDTL